MNLITGHGTEDTFISPRHSERLEAAYGGEDCKLLTFSGDHNSVRPQHFHAAVLAFFDAVLQCRSPPSAPNSVASSGWASRACVAPRRQPSHYHVVHSHIRSLLNMHSKRRHASVLTHLLPFANGCGHGRESTIDITRHEEGARGAAGTI